MEQLQLLGVALGFAMLSGLNLYLTVFVTGLAVQQQWITLLPQYESLSILAHPAVLAIAGVMYLLQFFADKVPWVDSLWDAVHTLIRPIGGAFLAVRVLGTPDPVYDVIVALLGGSVALVAHTTKAGVRLVANHSPEPFSNIALSVGEDAAVLGGLALMSYNPVIALAAFAAVLLAIVYFGPRMFRALRVNLWMLWRKLASPAADLAEVELPTKLPSRHDMIFHAHNLLAEKIAWAVPCISGAAKRIPGNIFGYLVTTQEDASKAWFVGKIGWREIAEELDLATYKVAHEPKFLTDNLVLYSLEKKPKYSFFFDRTQRALVKRIAVLLEERIASVPAMAAEPALLAKSEVGAAL